jgi:hypothetical protein
MTTFSLNANQIAAIASIGAACNSTTDRKITPILGAIHVTVTPERVTAVATDRYIVTELSFPLGDTAHDLPTDGAVHAFQMTDRDWVALAKIVSGPDFKHSSEFFSFTTDDAGERPRVRVEYYDGRVLGDFAQVEGRYPAVSRLFADEVYEMHGTPAFMPDKLTRAMKAWAPEHTTAAQRKGTVWTFAANSASSEGRKLAPVVLTAATGPDTVLRSLVQPNLLRK